MGAVITQWRKERFMFMLWRTLAPDDAIVMKVLWRYHACDNCGFSARDLSGTFYETRRANYAARHFDFWNPDRQGGRLREFVCALSPTPCRMTHKNVLPSGPFLVKEWQ